LYDEVTATVTIKSKLIEEDLGKVMKDLDNNSKR